MNSIFLAILTFWVVQGAPPAGIPKNNPDGIWQTDTGSKFQLQLKGKDLKVQIVDGSNPKYVKYEVDLKNLEEINTYEGTGYFIAKLGSNGKECRFDTKWHLTVVQMARIIGNATNITPNPETCAVVKSEQVLLDMTKVK